MRNAIPLRWIEQAEARQVLKAALFEQAPTPAWWDMARRAAARWLSRRPARPGLEYPFSWPTLAVQPALVRAPIGGADRRRGEDDGYSREG